MGSGQKQSPQGVYTEVACLNSGPILLAQSSFFSARYLGAFADHVHVTFCVCGDVSVD